MTAQAMTFQLKDAVAHGSSLRASGELRTAQTLFEQITEQLPDHPAGWLGLGEVLLDQFKVAEAIVAFEQAMRIQGSSAKLHHALGAAKALIGRLLEAEAHYQEALKLNPRCAEYYFHYSRLRTFTPEDGFHHQIRELATRNDLTNQERCHLHFAAGKVCDDMGKFDEAFDHFRRGNECKQARYDRERWENRAGATIDVFGTALLQNLASQISVHASESTAIVFIVGMPRSGTSLVEQILASHKHVFGAGELPDLNLISAKVAEIAGPKDSYPNAVRALSNEVLAILGDQYCRRIRSMTTEPVSVFCDKTPNNYFFIGLMHGLFSNVRVIHCRRDPLDTALSCYITNFKQGQDFTCSLEGILHQHELYCRLMRHWEKAAMIPMLHMDYEHLVVNQEDATRQMIDFVGLPWSEDCLVFERTPRVVATASSWQVRQPMYRSSIGRWKNYAKYFEPLSTSLSIQPAVQTATHRIDEANEAVRPKSYDLTSGSKSRLD